MNHSFKSIPFNELAKRVGKMN